MNTFINKNTKSFKEFEKNTFDIICLIGKSLTSYMLDTYNIRHCTKQGKYGKIES